jgi:hypothetical protein
MQSAQPKQEALEVFPRGIQQVRIMRTSGKQDPMAPKGAKQIGGGRVEALARRPHKLISQRIGIGPQIFEPHLYEFFERSIH